MRSGLATITSFLLIACSGQAAARPTTSSTTQTTAGSVSADGCGVTAVVRGGVPGWLDEASGHNNPTGLRYVIGHPALAAGFLFGDPLRAVHPENPANQLLWIVLTLRQHSQLVLDRHPLVGTEPQLHLKQPLTSVPSEINPSI